MPCTRPCAPVPHTLVPSSVPSFRSSVSRTSPRRLPSSNPSYLVIQSTLSPLLTLHSAESQEKPRYPGVHCTGKLVCIALQSWFRVSDFGLHSTRTPPSSPVAPMSSAQHPDTFSRRTSRKRRENIQKRTEKAKKQQSRIGPLAAMEEIAPGSSAMRVCQLAKRASQHTRA